MITTLILIGIVVTITFLFMQQDIFGQNPNGTRVEILKKSSHYKEGTISESESDPSPYRGTYLLGGYDQISL